jgi:hypothetical protein
MVRLSAAAMQYDDVKRQALNAKVGTVDLQRRYPASSHHRTA